MSLRRFSVALLGEAQNPEAEVDLQLRGLYPDLQELEKKCDISLKDNKFILSLQSGESQTQQTLDVTPSSRTPEDILEHLPVGYFEKDYDPIVSHLEEISSWTEGDITERFMQKIEDTDSDKDVIVGHLTTMIDNNYDALMVCMTKIQEIDIFLIQAGIQISYTRKKIKAAQDSYHSGPVKVVKQYTRREKLQSILTTLQGLKSLKDIYKSMMNHINTGEIGLAAEYANSVLQSLKDQCFDQFISMKNIGNSMQKSMYAIRRKTDRALKRVSCRKFTALEYESIAKAYLLLDHIEKVFKLKNVDQHFVDDEFFYDSAHCIEGLPQRIIRFQLDDIDSCLHAAIVEYIYLGQQKKQKVAKEIALPGIYNHHSQDVGDLDEIPLGVLLRRMTAENLPICVVRACELLADIIHTHYLITQWHISPFDNRNHNLKFLHRSSVNMQQKKGGDDIGDFSVLDASFVNADQSDDEDVDDEVELFRNETTNGQNNNIHQKSFGFDRSSWKSSDLQLMIASQELSKSRILLWEEVVRGLINLLSATIFTSEVKLDDFVSMTWAINLIVILGKEFAGSDSKTLVASLKEKSEEFFRNYHLETFQVIRMMIDAEFWHNIPLNITSAGGILNTIQQTYGMKNTNDVMMRRKSINNGNSVPLDSLSPSISKLKKSPKSKLHININLFYL
jgi:hypothetical protein